MISPREHTEEEKELVEHRQRAAVGTGASRAVTRSRADSAVANARAGGAAAYQCGNVPYAAEQAGSAPVVHDIILGAVVDDTKHGWCFRAIYVVQTAKTSECSSNTGFAGANVLTCCSKATALCRA
jgi:hypothetical protein